jgi:Protein of unknown function (DUF3040)
MPLSDREEKLLAQMEKALLADDPRLVSALTGAPTKSSRRNLGLAVLLFFAGFAGVLAGVFSKTAPISWAGFIVSLIGASILANGLKAKVSALASGQRPAKPVKKGFKERMEERWDNNGRQDPFN